LSTGKPHMLKTSTVSEAILKPRTLTVEDLPFLANLGTVENGILILERSSKGYKLKTPVQVPLERVLAVGERGLVKYVIRSLTSERPRLIPFVLENQTVLELARYLLRWRTGSPKTLYLYVDCIARYSNRIGVAPDGLISDVKDPEGMVRLKKLPRHIKALEHYVAELQDQRLAPSRISNYVKAIRALYRVNSVDIKLPYTLSRRSVRKDRAPRPEELLRLLDVADLREKVITSMLSLGGFREGTLVRLRYSHVSEDLKRRVLPLHIHVEAEITKGKYHDYDTFLGSEAVDYLRFYLDARRDGNLQRRLQPENIDEDSPLICDIRSRHPKPIGEKQIYKLIHELYFKADLLRKNRGGGYDLKVHSIRKFFETQMLACGIQPDYVKYMMGHTVSTYNDIKSLGIERLRSIYAGASLNIRPRQAVSKIEML
jgi:site-specific recombinase XerD